MDSCVHLSFKRIAKLAIVCFPLASLALGQTSEDARKLLHEVAEASRNVHTYRADGHISENLDMGLLGGKENFVFHFALRAPDQMRMEVSGGESFETGLPFLAVCDGKANFVYYSKGNEYRKIELGSETEDYCKPSLLTTSAHVDEEVKSARIVGHDASKFDGHLQSCVVVKALYRVINDFLITPPLLARVGRVSRTMCIEPTRKLILRDHLEADIEASTNGGHVNQTITYDGIEPNPELAANLFEFHPPQLSKLFEPRPIQAAKRIALPETTPSSLSHVIARPEAISETKPEYSQEAWDEGIQGQIILTVGVEIDGSLHDFKIEQSLGYGLDEKAIECVRNWRFKPATNDSKPVPGRAYITMAFVLPDKRPAQPSPFPVSRPVPLPILPKNALHSRSVRDEFFNAVAHAFQAPDLCGRVDATAKESDGNTWGAPRGMQIEKLRSRCYLDLAVGLADTRLCDHVEPVRMDGYDGREVNPTYCRNQIPAGARPRIGPISNMGEDIGEQYLQGFVEIMRQLGYNNQVLEYLYRRNWHETPTTSAYEEIKNDSGLLRLARGGPSYDGSISPGNVRSGNAVEYLYYFLALDNSAPTLCAKISPNAVFGVKGLLRAACYRNVAVKEHDANLCGQLPLDGTVPAASRFYSKEDCTSFVTSGKEELHRSQVLDYPPFTFPQPEFLGDALRTIGDTRHANALANPPAQEYWYFLYDLAARGDLALRTQFLQRVRAMK